MARGLGRVIAGSQAVEPAAMSAMETTRYRAVADNIGRPVVSGVASGPHRRDGYFASVAAWRSLNAAANSSSTPPAIAAGTSQSFVQSCGIAPSTR